jgi:hypothetical protein
LKIQKGNQNPSIEGQKAQWPKEKVQKDKHQSTQHTHKTKDRATIAPAYLSLRRVIIFPEADCSLILFRPFGFLVPKIL